MAEVTRSIKICDQRLAVGVGGVGGSGTRLVARCLMELGYYLGDDQNDAHDNLWFTLLFKRAEILSAPDSEIDRLAEIFFKVMTGTEAISPVQAAFVRGLAERDRLQHRAWWLRSRAESLLSAGRERARDDRWGWKEPHTHIVMGRLRERLGRLKYIHVARNGLDMAHSRNQNQLKLWGRAFLGREPVVSPRDSLKFWCAVHRRILETRRVMGADFLWLDYDDFCARPAEGIATLAAFLELDVTGRVEPLRDLVAPPESVGRFKAHGLEIFDPADVAYVAELGFDTSLPGAGR